AAHVRAGAGLTRRCGPARDTMTVKSFGVAQPEGARPYETIRRSMRLAREALVVQGAGCAAGNVCGRTISSRPWTCEFRTMEV
ncbi:MAG: hypothetical protein ACRYG8_30195, partial [Janthinobacterium lividum]